MTTEITLPRSEESRNAERFRRLMLSTSAAIIRVSDDEEKNVIQVTVEVTKGAKSNAPLRTDVINAIDAMLGIN